MHWPKGAEGVTSTQMPVYAELHVQHIWYQQFPEYDSSHHYVNKDSPAVSFAIKTKQP